MDSNLLCRLCLEPSDTEKTLKLSDGCDFVTKLSFCLSHHIQVTQDLPNRICEECYDNVEKINIFREKIIHNEYILQNRLKDPISFVESNKDIFDKCDTINECDYQTVNTKIEHNKDNSLKDYALKESYSQNIDIKTEHNIENDLKDDTIKKSDYQNVNTKIEHDTENGSKGEINSDCLDDISENEQLECHSISEDGIPVDIVVPEQIENSYLIEDNMCLTCFKKFPTRLELIHHYKNVERLKHKNSDTENKLEKFKYNIVNSNGNSLFRCSQCSKEYTSKKCIKRHFLSHCLADRPFLCKLCGRTFKTVTEIANHAKVHGGYVFVCSFKCGYRSVHKHVIKDHERRHRKEFKYKCETCGKQFQVKTWYLQHQNIHNGIKPYVCKICGMAFYLDRYLTQHRNTVHPQVVTQKRYLCVHCSLPFTCKSGLALHQKEHDVGTCVESLFLCDECGKVLKSPRQLKCHKKIHLNPKPYVCGTCEKKFAKKFNLRVHEMSHKEVRFPCDKCAKRFSQRSSLNRHLLRCREFVQKCARCSKTYYNKNDYLKHNKICS